MGQKEKPIRVLISKSEQDCHDIGTRYIVKLLQDAGMEVVFTRYFIADEVVKTALEEDVDIIGLSFYSSGLMYDTTEVLKGLKENGMQDTALILGGTISKKEEEMLLEMGISRVFVPGRGTPKDIPAFILSHFEKHGRSLEL